MVDRRDFGVKEVAVGLVEVDPFPDDSLVVLVQWEAISIECAGSLEGAGLNFKNVVAAVAILVDPLADRIAFKRRLDLRRPIPSVGIDAAKIAQVVAARPTRSAMLWNGVLRDCSIGVRVSPSCSVLATSP